METSYLAGSRKNFYIKFQIFIYFLCQACIEKKNCSLIVIMNIFSVQLNILMNDKSQVLYMFYMHVYLTSFNFFIIIKANSDINFWTYFSRWRNALSVPLAFIFIIFLKIIVHDYFRMNYLSMLIHLQ